MISSLSRIANGDRVARLSASLGYILALLYVLQFTSFYELGQSASARVESTLGETVGMLVLMPAFGLLVVFPTIGIPVMMYSLAARRASAMIVTGNLILGGLFCLGIAESFSRPRWIAADMILVGHLIANGARLPGTIPAGVTVGAWLFLLAAADLLLDSVPWFLLNVTAVVYSVAIAGLVTFRKIEVEQWAGDYDRSSKG